jgi:L-rhamnose-H+ transport protein
MWGIILKEWKSVKTSTINIMIPGILILLMSTLVIGYGKSITIEEIVNYIIN